VLATRPETPVRAVIALGGNLGDRMATLRSALAALAAVPGIVVRRCSPVVETAPVGGVAQPDYLNAVAELETGLSPWELLDACHQVEAAHGRTRELRWGARTLDLDVITFGALRTAAPGLELPHPRAHERAFVLAPWTLLDPDAELPTAVGDRRVADLLTLAADRDDVHRRPELGRLEPGSPQPGSPQPGSPQPGNPQPGNPQPGSAEPEAAR
jgi:2-amino-4-hydroxy-6-hydroxymethyldihydropteridine diphosphokinase